MLPILLTTLITFITITLFGYISHYALHQSWSGRFHRSHMTHHQRLYPATFFYSDTYLDPGPDNTVIIFILAGLPLIFLPFILWLLHWITWPLLLTALCSLALFGIPHDYLHDQFHLRNTWLRRFQWFQHLTDLHYQHHLGNMQTNFGIYWFGWDRVFGSFITGK